MRTLFRAILAICCVATVDTLSATQHGCSQLLLSVQERGISVTGSPEPLYFTTRGSIDSTTFYQIKKSPCRRIMAYLDTPLPKGTKLYVTLEAPGQATSLGAVELSTTPVAVVDEIDEDHDNKLLVIYELKTQPGVVTAPLLRRAVSYVLSDL